MSFPRRYRLGVWIGLGIALAACSVEFDPVAESDFYYTVWGFVDTDAPVQKLRVIPIREGVDPPDSLLDIPTVITTIATTGVEVVWRDSVVSLNGASSLIYTTTAPFDPSQTVVLRVDGARGVATASTSVPNRPGNPDSVHTSQYPSLAGFPIFWPGVTNVIAVDVFYAVHAHHEPSVDHPPLTNSSSTWISYPDLDRGDLEGNTWVVPIRWVEDRAIISATLGPGLPELDCLVIRISEPSEGWQPPPGGVFDPDILVQPGVFSNVSNGLGWFGSVSRSSFAWPVINTGRDILDPIGFESVPRDANECLDLSRERF